jgi:glutathionylspermidine synthase
MNYHAFAARVRETRVLVDPWICGEERFREEPIVLRPEERDELFAAAEEIGAVYNELVRICAASPRLVDAFFRLTPCQKLMWLASAPAWHGVARADVFRTADGALQVCELNCDTPSGQAEAALLGGVVTQGLNLTDANEDLLPRYCRMIASLGDTGSVGVVYPTEMTEDLSMVQLYARAFEAMGLRVTLGSPYNLGEEDGRLTLFGRACDVLVRHYKTDWWGEREPVWTDAAPVPDAEPLHAPLGVALRAQVSGACAIVNPFGAVLPQNKRAMALMWEEIARFPAWAQDAIRRLVPFTKRLETAQDEARANKDAWVIKSDYGCEGVEIVLGAECTDEEWRAALDLAAPGRWIAQRRFRPRLEDGEATNYGVYLVAGEASGVLARVQAGATDRFARTAAVLVGGGR